MKIFKEDDVESSNSKQTKRPEKNILIKRKDQTGIKQNLPNKKQKEEKKIKNLLDKNNENFMTSYSRSSGAGAKNREDQEIQKKTKSIIEQYRI